MRVRLVVFAVLLVVTAGTLLAQEQALLTGLVTTKEDGRPYPGAIVSIPDLAVSATADKDGRYVLPVPVGAVGQTVEVKAAALGLSSKSVKVTLQGTRMTQDFAMSVAYHSEVTVGSRAAAAQAEKAVPVDVISEKTIEAASGSAETSQVVEQIAPSFNFPRPSISDGTDSVRPATLRSLGPDQVLVLLNGKRRHTSALLNVNGTVGKGSTGVDLNAIPAAAIDKIEVLRDGAAAQYGSDAIAGVLNIVLKDAAAPLAVSVEGGTTTHGDGGLLDVNATYGWKLGDGAFNFTGEYRNRNATNRASPDPRPQGSRDPIDQPNTHWGDAKERDFIGFVNGSVPLGDGATSFYLFGGASRRDGEHGGNFRRALQSQNWPQLYPNGFLPLIEPAIVDVSGTVGLRGLLGGAWIWDLSAQYGHNKFSFYVENSLNTSLGPTIPPNQTKFYSGSLVFNHFVGNLDVSRQVSVGLAGPLNVAFGAEFRRENFQQLAGEPNSYIDGGVPDRNGAKAPAGAQVFPGYRPSNEVDASRNSFAAYLDLEADVVSLVRFGLAGRYEHYTDFGDTKDVKGTIRIQAAEKVVLRGAAQTGFRAPSLSQANFSAVSTRFLNVNGVLTPFDVGTFRVDSALARALGAQPLRPEDSVNFSGGVVVSPASAFDVTVDYFNIRIKNRVIQSGSFTGSSIAAILAPFNATAASFFTNAIDTRSEGIEATVNTRLDLGRAGLVRMQAGYARSVTDITRIAQTPAQLAALQSTLFDRLEQRRLTCGQPRDSGRITGEWTKGPMHATARANRYGEVCGIINSLPADDESFGAKWIVDTNVSRDFGSFTATLGVDNIFDTFPDRQQRAGNSNSGINTYPNNSPFGFNGRFVYTRLTYAF